MTITTMPVTSSSLVSMVEKIFRKSPSRPPGPVRWWFSSGGEPSSTIFLTLSTEPANCLASPLPSPVNGTTISSACRSALSIGGGTGGTTAGSSANATASSSAALRSAWVTPPGRSYTTSVMVSRDLNFLISSCTLVASALPGRNDALSFFWTSDSFPVFVTVTAPTENHATTSPIATNSRCRPPALRPSAIPASPTASEHSDLVGPYSRPPRPQEASR